MAKETQESHIASYGIQLLSDLKKSEDPFFGKTA
jgi:hypothetical protein